jgi:translin
VNNLDAMAEEMRKALAEKDEAREKMLPLCRDAIRYSSTAIRAVHRQEFDEAIKLVKSARDVLIEAEKAVAKHSELANTGAVRDAQKELAEANITLALVTGKALPKPAELGVDVAAYLNGLGEAVGEIRRYLLDGMRKGDLSRGEELLAVMDDIYSMLVTMDFPDALTGGLRRTTDMVRGVLERTRSDLTLTIRQKDLETKLTAFQRQSTETAESSEADLRIETKPVVRGEEPELDSREQELYKALSEWRSQKANEENLAPFIIAHNAWLKQIVKMRPTTPKELGEIVGFGERRVNKYGKEIIEVVKGSN